MSTLEYIAEELSEQTPAQALAAWMNAARLEAERRIALRQPHPLPRARAEAADLTDGLLDDQTPRA